MNEGTSFPQNPALPDDVLAKQQSLPRKPDPVTLTGRYFELKPLVLERDAAPLYHISNGEALSIGSRHFDAYDAGQIIWRYMFAGPFVDEAAMTAYLRPQVDASNGLCLCAFDLTTGAQVGVMNYMNNFPEHLKIELGSIWYSPIVQRTQANLECTYLVLKHAFELGYRRVEWKCDSLNERSRRSALRMGFTFEGIQEYHFIIKGRNRDTAWFRILDKEWNGIRAKLESMLDY
ncbi:MAG TPA: GNAT family protein [Phototrophicaceae bacterium]|nr:GNAT family protein [Phototrophicaceae bacterium]